MKIFRLLLVLCFYLPLAVDAAITLEIRPQPMVANQSGELVFRAPFDTAAEPDFEQLAGDFDILSRNRQTSISWVNGKREQATVWKLGVVPKRTGELTVPALSFGTNKSPARTIKVLDAPRQDLDSGAEILLEVEADTRTPYVQQQVIYTVRLYSRVDLSSPRFSALDTSGDAIIKSLGEGRQYLHKVNDVTYEAFESKFAIFPQHSGTLTIQPMVLTTQIVQRRRNLFDPFSQSLQTRRLQSEAVELDVKPVPASFPAGAVWLPAKRLRLHDEWEPAVRTAKAGEPLSRTIVLWADGLVSGQLPEVTVTPPTGVKQYPDQPQTSEKESATGFTAVAQQKFAFIATSGGHFEFEEIRVPWWNTETDDLETAIVEISEAKFEAVQPASADRPDDVAPAPPSSTTPSADTGPDFWRNTAAGLGLAWLLTSLILLRKTFRASPTDEVESSPRDSRNVAAAAPAAALQRACAQNDAPAAIAALNRWRRAKNDNRDIRQRATGPERALEAAIAELERSQYGPERGQWTGTTLWQAFAEANAGAEKAPAAGRSGLPPLFRLQNNN